MDAKPEQHPISGIAVPAGIPAPQLTGWEVAGTGPAQLSAIMALKTAMVRSQMVVRAIS
jgi:hypothetical protein